MRLTVTNSAIFPYFSSRASVPSSALSLFLIASHFSSFSLYHNPAPYCSVATCFSRSLAYLAQPVHSPYCYHMPVFPCFVLVLLYKKGIVRPSGPHSSSLSSCISCPDCRPEVFCLFVTVGRVLKLLHLDKISACYLVVLRLELKTQSC